MYLQVIQMNSSSIIIRGFHQYVILNITHTHDVTWSPSFFIHSNSPVFLIKHYDLQLSILRLDYKMKELHKITSLSTGRLFFNPYLPDPVNFVPFGMKRHAIFGINLINILDHNFHMICICSWIKLRHFSFQWYMTCLDSQLFQPSPIRFIFSTLKILKMGWVN